MGNFRKVSKRSGTGALLYARRIELGLNLRDVATRTGLSVATVSFYERGRTELKPFRIRQFADALELNVADFARRVIDLQMQETE